MIYHLKWRNNQLFLGFLLVLSVSVLTSIVVVFFTHDVEHTLKLGTISGIYLTGKKQHDVRKYKQSMFKGEGMKLFYNTYLRKNMYTQKATKKEIKEIIADVFKYNNLKLKLNSIHGNGNSHSDIYYPNEMEIKHRRNKLQATFAGKNNIKPKSNKDKVKTILFWTSYFEHKDYKIGFGTKPFTDYGCEVDTCRTTNDKTLLNTSDAVVIHINNLKRPKKPPIIRFPWQHWVFFLTESPVHSVGHIKLKEYNGLFNITQTYRLDSDVKHVYGKLVDLTKEEKLSLSLPSDFAMGKTKLVAWFVSHCKVQSERLAYAKELNKHIPVDIYGRCGPLKCKDRNKCYAMLNATYKFYLSFENSFCKDYVTEKLWNILQLNVVPIVLGMFDYKKHLPQNSYIDVRDFTSPKQLGDYLMKLDGNDILYNEYFKWKHDHKVIYPHDMASFCDLCKYLHENESKRKYYNNLDKWWNEHLDCVPANIYYLHHADIRFKENDANLHLYGLERLE